MLANLCSLTHNQFCSILSTFAYWYRCFALSHLLMPDICNNCPNLAIKSVLASSVLLSCLWRWLAYSADILLQIVTICYLKIYTLVLLMSWTILSIMQYWVYWVEYSLTSWGTTSIIFGSLYLVDERRCCKRKKMLEKKMLLANDRCCRRPSINMHTFEVSESACCFHAPFVLCLFHRQCSHYVLDDTHLAMPWPQSEASLARLDQMAWCKVSLARELQHALALQHMAWDTTHT